MTKAEIFKKAHRLAKTLVGNYIAKFTLALKTIYKEIKELALQVSEIKKWEAYGKSRIYFKAMVSFVYGQTPSIEKCFYDVINNSFVVELPAHAQRITGGGILTADQKAYIISLIKG